MKILQNAGTYEILTPIEWLSQMPMLIERAGRTAYQSYKCKVCNGAWLNPPPEDGPASMVDCSNCGNTGVEPITHESAAKFIRMLIKRGHESVLEHSLMTVRFIDCSRGFTHELVRHRLCAFTQESTRYVDEKGTDVVCAGHQDPLGDVELDLNTGDDSTYSSTFYQMTQNALDNYKALREAGWKPEDARQILPIGITSEIVVSANLREWRHIFKMRTDKPAHWEIRKVMCDLLAELKKGPVGVLFEDFYRYGPLGDDDKIWYEKKMKV